MTLQMADFVGWVKGLVGVVSALSFLLIESGLNECQCVLTYRRVDDDEIQDAVQELYGYRQMSYVNVEAKEGEGDHDSGTVTDMKAWVLIRRRVEGSARLFFHDYDKPKYSDIQAAYRDESSDDDSGDDESAAAHPMSTELSSMVQTSTQTEDRPGEELRPEPTSTDYTTARAETSSLLISMAQLSMQEQSPACMRVDNLAAAGPHVREGHEPHATPRLASIEGEHKEDVAAGTPPNARGLDSSPEPARTETTHVGEGVAGILTRVPAAYSKIAPTSLKGDCTEDAVMGEVAGGAHTTAPAVHSTPESLSIENTHTEDSLAAAHVNLPREHSGHELARTEFTDTVTCPSAVQSTRALPRIEHAEDAAEDTPTAHSTAKTGLTDAEYGREAMAEDAAMQDGATGVLTCAPVTHETHELVAAEGAHTGDVEMEDAVAGRHIGHATAQPAQTERTEEAVEDAPTTHTTAEGASIEDSHKTHMATVDRGMLLSAPKVLLARERAETEGLYSDNAAMEDAAAGVLTFTPAMYRSHELAEGEPEPEPTGDAAMDDTTVTMLASTSAAMQELADGAARESVRMD